MAYATALVLSPSLLYSFNTEIDERSAYTQPLAKGIRTAEERLKEYYYQLIANNYFDTSYSNQLVLGNINLDHANILSKGTMLLKLIDELTKKNDKSAKVLLRRLNKFFAFKMHRLLADNDLRQKQSVRMLGCLDELYGHKIATPSGIVAPFRTLLTKAFIVLAMVNDGNISFGSRKETMLWHMNKLKHELLAVNRQLGEQKIDEIVIKDFVILLAVCETKQPIIQTNRLKEIFKEILLYTAVISAAGLLMYWQRKPLKKFVVDPVVTAANDFIGAFGDGLKALAKAAGKGAAEGAMEHIDQHKNTIKAGIVHVATEAVGAAIPEALRRATHDPIPEPVPLPAGQTTLASALGGQIGTDAGKNIARELTHPFPKNQAPVVGPDETTHGIRLGEDIATGVTRGAASAPGNFAYWVWSMLHRMGRRGAPAGQAPQMAPAEHEQAPNPAARPWRPWHWRPW